jgi:bacterioferritin-associated ferredoxin
MSWDFRQPGTRICVCYDVTNSQALDVWRGGAATVGKLTQLFDCGRNCAMCIPYFETLLSEFQQGKWPAQAEPGKQDASWFGGKNG